MGITGAKHQGNNFSREGVVRRDQLEMSAYQRRLLEAAQVLGLAISPFAVSDMVSMLAAGGETVSHRGVGGLGRSLKALAGRGLLVRSADGRYRLPDAKAAEMTGAQPAADAPFISPPTMRQLMAGRARPARLPVSFEEPLWPEDAAR